MVLLEIGEYPLTTAAFVDPCKNKPYINAKESATESNYP